MKEWLFSEVIFDLAGLNRQLKELDDELSRQTLWEDQEKAQTKLKERSRFQGEIENWSQKEKELEEILILSEICRETDDQKDLEELVGRVDSLDQALGRYEIERMLGGENDEANAIVYIDAGAGGTEA